MSTNYKDLVRELAEVDPLTWSTEGLDDECLFCGAYAEHGPTFDSPRTAAHKTSCLWVRARLIIGTGQ